MRQHRLFLVAIGLCVASTPILFAQNPRQAARLERRDARQDLRVNNRSTYFSDQTWTQLSPWVQRNNIQPLPATRVGAAVGAAANATGRAANAAANATARAANAAGNAADRVASGVNAGVNAAANTAAAANVRYGYSTTSASAPQGWFYDYYSYSPTYYAAPTLGSSYYSSASRYYDYNNDGIYDSLSTYRDADKSGAYQVYDQLDFGTSGDRTSESSEYVSDAHRHTVTGTVEASKTAKVNGSENLVVRLASEDSKADAVIVDLGPTERWKSAQVKEGDKLSATGPMEHIGEKQVLIAESVTLGQQKEITIARSGPAIEGQVLDVTRAEVKGTEHVLAVVQAEKNRQIVDLGPADRLKVKVEPQTKIVVQGVPVQFRDYSVVLADRIDLDGQTIAIQRW